MGNRYVTIIYTAGFLLFSVIFAKLTNLIWETAQIAAIDVIPNQLSLGTLIGVIVAAALTFYLYKQKDAHQYVVEVVQELELVDWPTWKETQKSTIVVIIFTLVLSAYLFFVDSIWRYLTDHLLSA